ncbi:ATP-dependent DNA helicase [Pantoea phage vB_PagM_LIET2]|uniref:ATP-dependent DNA helicase n=1 Tax=Pantoea phage vB_PagM_LIET2 TaxID=2508071 RepID=A0A411AWC4_9CAUD|nr:ATP-dependent DNA helicase [Pantoea phage vB_PagM_LIET2]QAX92365.1 ATP-dependent DNA helicase [Pantoea phage vB_PagM_LIET2]
MAFSLRPYQAEAVGCTLAHINHSMASAVIVLPTGAGKSLVVAELARLIHQRSNKPVLCLAPSAELVTQNRAKFMSYGYNASIYSSSAGGKSLRHPVVFGSPKTVYNDLKKFGDFAAIIVDECQGITPTLVAIIDALRAKNPRVRLVGLTATPYRMGTGYIYKYHYINGPTDESNAYKPYFDTVVYELHASQLIQWGFLNPPRIGEVSESYDTSGLTLNRMGQFDAEKMSAVFEGWGRKTSLIVADVVRKSWNMRSVLMFAATREHANEVMASLPPGEFGAVFSNTPRMERTRILSDFTAGRFKYMVNQRILQVGFDSPLTDVIAVLTATESPGLYQQIVGRGTRLCDEPYPDGRMKDHFLLLDYGGNIERHFGETGDVFTPEIVARKPPEGTPYNVTCPACNFVNTFTLRPNPEGLDIDKEGYFIDKRGRRVLQEVLKARRDEHGVYAGDFEYKDVPIPAHYGRRCINMITSKAVTRELVRCSHLFEYKDCPECGEPNDIAARFCSTCKGELVNPNEKLALEAARLEADPYAIKTAGVTRLYFTRTYTETTGDEAVRVSFVTDHKLKKFQQIEQTYAPDSEKASAIARWRDFSNKAWGEVLTVEQVIARRLEAKLPKAIRFQRKKGSRFIDLKNIIWGE